MSKTINYNIYDIPPMSRNKYGVVNNSTILNPTNSLFGVSDVATSVDISNTGSSGTYIPDFIGATDELSGVRGLVPAPSAGEQNDYFLSANGGWKYDVPYHWLKEWPYDSLTPTGLGIDGDFHVNKTLSALNLEVEGRAHFFELVIDKINSTNGSIIISPSSFRVDKVGRRINYSLSKEPFTSLFNYRPDIQRTLNSNNIITLIARRVYMRDDDGNKAITGTVNVGDMVRCKSFNIKSGVYENVSNKDYWTFVVGKGNENYEIVRENGSREEVSATYIDLAWYFYQSSDNGKNLTLGTVFGTSSIITENEIDIDFYDVNYLKNQSSYTWDGTSDLTSEYHTEEELLEDGFYVLSSRGCPLPSDIQSSNLVGVPTNPSIDLEPVTGATSYTSPDYNISKYSYAPYDKWVFGYGELDVDVDDELVCFGSLHDTDRRNIILLSSTTPLDSELKAPAMAQYNGIDIFGEDIARFRITAISYGRNIFKGDFEVETSGGNYENVLTVTYNQSQSIVNDSENRTYSYINQKSDEISTYVYSAYSYSLRYTGDSYNSALNYTNQAYISSISYTTQKADSISSYVVSSYAYALDYTNQAYNDAISYATQTYIASISYITQTATEINSTVHNLQESTYSSITQLSDQINLAVTHDEMELVGIHLDGENSTVNIVGSLSVKQNGDGDVDTIKVYDSNDELRVEITPESIPAKDDLGITTTSITLTSPSWSWTKTHASGSTTLKYNAVRTLATFSEGEVISLISPTIRLELLPNSNDVWTTNNAWINQIILTMQVVDASDNVVLISKSLSRSINPSDVSGSGKILTVGFNDTTTAPPLTSQEAGTYRMKIQLQCTLTSAGAGHGWDLNSETVYGSISRTLSTGYDTTFMKIGTNGFYYSGGTGKYLYSGEDGFEFSYNSSKVSVDSEDVKIHYNSYSSSSSYIYIGSTNNTNTYSSVVNCTGGSTISNTQNIYLGNTSVYGIGRELSILGYEYLIIYVRGDSVYLGSRLTNQGKETYRVDNNGTIILGNSNVYQDTTFATLKANGLVKFIALADGWHLLSANYYG